MSEVNQFSFKRLWNEGHALFPPQMTSFISRPCENIWGMHSRDTKTSVKVWWQPTPVTSLSGRGKTKVFGLVNNGSHVTFTYTNKSQCWELSIILRSLTAPLIRHFIWLLTFWSKSYKGNEKLDYLSTPYQKQEHFLTIWQLLTNSTLISKTFSRPNLDNNSVLPRNTTTPLW